MAFQNDMKVAVSLMTMGLTCILRLRSTCLRLAMFLMLLSMWDWSAELVMDAPNELMALFNSHNPVWTS